MKIPQNIDTAIEGQYCLHCYSAKVARIFKNDKTFYFCNECQKLNERSLVIDNSINWWIDNENNYWHESVGAAVINEKNELLAIMRTIYPFAYALPAGHINKGEEPVKAMQRELQEELGVVLPMEDFKSVRDFELPNDSCRRGSDHHFWHLYLVKNDSLRKTIQLNDEANSFSWLNLDTIASRSNLSYPLRFIAEKFGNNLR